MKFKPLKLILLLLLHLTSCFHGPLDYHDQFHWPDICPFGTHQSPINLPLPDECTKSLTYFSIKQVKYTPLNNKHLEYANEYTFKLDTSTNGFIKVVINNKTYKYNLNNIHFHLNSEHTINGKLYSSEMHLVHTLDPSEKDNLTEDEFEYNKYLVVGAIFEPIEDVQDNSFFNKLNFNSRSDVSNLNWNSFLTDDNDIYYYHGSLTTPGCDEKVNWVIINRIYPISQKQFEEFKNYIGNVYPDGNNRKIQRLNERIVYYILRENEGGSSFVGVFLGAVIIAGLFYAVYWYYRKYKLENAAPITGVYNLKL